MKKMKMFYLVVVLAASALLLYVVNAQAVTEEARRHMARGEAAVEMAKSPEDYEAAIKEFQEAARLAPTWAAAYYKLGMAQEKAGKFREAIVSLKRYLQLAPNAPDAAKVKELIYKLEYKAERENILTTADIVDILVSFGKEETWEIVKKGDGFTDAYTFITRVGNDRIKVPKSIYFSGHGYRVCEAESFNIIKIEGPLVKFVIVVSHCGCPLCQRADRWINTVEYEVEVVSKTYVKARCMTHVRGEGYVPESEYRKR